MAQIEGRGTPNLKVGCSMPHYFYLNLVAFLLHSLGTSLASVAAFLVASLSNHSSGGGARFKILRLEFRIRHMAKVLLTRLISYLSLFHILELLFTVFSLELAKGCFAFMGKLCLHQAFFLCKHFNWTQIGRMRLV